MIRFILGVVSIIFLFGGACALEETEAQIKERLVSYQRCRIDSDCGNNSFCYENDYDRIGRCKCQAGFELLARNRTYYACLKFAAWGEECELSNQCVDTLGSLANCDGVCGCSEGSFKYDRDGRCYQRILLEDFCRTDANCLLDDGSYAFCTFGTCQCPIGRRPTADKKRCIIARNLGQNCTHDNQCSFIDNSVCRDVCRCSMGHVVSRNGTTCLKAATYFFDPCEEDDQCSEFLRNSVCTNSNCTCEDGHHGYENRCVRSANIGEACTGTHQCIPAPQFQTIVDCIEGVCQCLPGVTDPDGRMGCSKNHGVKFSLNGFLLGFCIVLYKLLFL